MSAPAVDDDSETRPWKRAALWLTLLGALFFASYGFANWLASQRANIGAIVFGWERHIPYLPWTIIPYWSIDLFYAISLFLCTTRKELDTHGKRLLAAQIIAITCFLLFPLRQTFTRPDTGGIFGLMFDALLAFDQPFNQAPALHIALLIILWALFEKHASGFWRWALHAWFALIGISVLTTYQHHFVDVPTGLLLGWFCMWLFPDDSKSLLSRAALTANPRRRVLALRYVLGAMAFAALAIWLNGWGRWLLWMSVSLGVVAVIYLCLDADAFGKRADGTMSMASRWLFAPYLLGAWLNSRWWTRNTNPADRLTPEVWIGRIPLRTGEIPYGIATIVDLCAELPCTRGNAHYIGLPALDLVPMTENELRHAAQAIENAIPSGPVLVCCALGFSRSASAAAAWLILGGRAANAADAVAKLSEARPGVVLGREYFHPLSGMTPQTQKQAV